MVDALQQIEQTAHVAAPLVEHVVRVARLGEVDDPRRTVDLGVYRLGRHQVADVPLRLVLVQVQELRQAPEFDPCVVLGHHAHVVLDDPLAQVLPALERVRIGRIQLRVEDVRAAQLWAKVLHDLVPTHELVHREQLQQPSFDGNQGQPLVLLDTVQQVMLFVVIGRKHDIVDDPRKDLVSSASSHLFRGCRDPTARNFSGSCSIDSVSRTSR